MTDEGFRRLESAAYAMLLAATLLSGCGASALDRGRSAVAVTARAVAAADSVAADVIERRFDAVETPEQLERERERADRVVRAFTSAHAVIVAADTTLDVAETAGAEGASWQDALVCVMPALLHLADVLAAYGVSDAVTEPLRFAVGVLSQFLGGECRAP